LDSRVPSRARSASRPRSRAARAQPARHSCVLSCGCKAGTSPAAALGGGGGEPRAVNVPRAVPGESIARIVPLFSLVSLVELRRDTRARRSGPERGVRLLPLRYATGAARRCCLGGPPPTEAHRKGVRDPTLVAAAVHREFSRGALDFLFGTTHMHWDAASGERSCGRSPSGRTVARSEARPRRRSVRGRQDHSRHRRRAVPRARRDGSRDPEGLDGRTRAEPGREQAIRPDPAPAGAGERFTERAAVVDFYADLGWLAPAG